MTKLAYIRVSTNEQSVENQKMRMESLGIEKYFEDSGVSGTIKDRQGLNNMIDYLRDTDVVYVVSLDRLSRNMADLEQIQAKIKAKGAILLPLDILEQLGMTDIPNDAVSKMVFDIISVVSSYTAENERIKMLERQKLGIQRAKSEGKYQGGKIQYNKNATGRALIVYQETFKMLADKKSIKNIADTLNISRNTVYSLKNRINNEILALKSQGKDNLTIANELKINQNYTENINWDKP